MSHQLTLTQNVYFILKSIKLYTCILDCVFINSSFSLQQTYRGDFKNILVGETE